MSALEEIGGVLRPWLPVLAVLAITAAAITAAKLVFRKRRGQAPEGQFVEHLGLLALTFAGLLAVITVFPTSEALRGQLLGLLGLLLSASLALSSTTLVGNALAGVLLRVVGNFGIGDHVRVDGAMGRVTERGLFHTEIQTEDRDLTTLPNLFLVNRPVTVVRHSGTIVSTRVSIGYDVPWRTVQGLLREAGARAGLEEPFVEIVELGDFSVTYRAAGLLPEVKQILSTRSQLRAEVLDALHGGGIEIVSPTFMNTRSLPVDQVVAPRPGDGSATGRRVAEGAESVVFDKADNAASLAELESHVELARQELEALKEQSTGAADPQRQDLERRAAAAQLKFERLSALSEAARARHDQDD